MSELSLDTLLQLVADQRRRQAIQYLRYEAKDQTTIDELVDAILNNSSVTDKKPTDRDEIALQLYHTHLPKLADYGVIKFDPGTRHVRYQPDEQAENLLDSLLDEPSQARPSF